MQLSIFDLTPKNIIVEYWAYPFDKNGNYILTRMEKYTEVKNEFQITEFLKMLELVNYQGIKLK